MLALVARCSVLMLAWMGSGVAQERIPLFLEPVDETWDALTASAAFQLVTDPDDAPVQIVQTEQGWSVAIPDTPASTLSSLPAAIAYALNAASEDPDAFRIIEEAPAPVPAPEPAVSEPAAPPPAVEVALPAASPRGAGWARLDGGVVLDALRVHPNLRVEAGSGWRRVRLGGAVAWQPRQPGRSLPLEIDVQTIAGELLGRAELQRVWIGAAVGGVVRSYSFRAQQQRVFMPWAGVDLSYCTPVSKVGLCPRVQGAFDLGQTEVQGLSVGRYWGGFSLALEIPRPE